MSCRQGTYSDNKASINERFPLGLAMPCNRYEVLLADEPASLALHYQLRYQIYCVEKGYERPDAFPDGQESDAFDGDSVHFICRDRFDGETVGALRLVMPRAPRFPCEVLGQFDASVETGIARPQLAEISRLCLARHVDKRQAASELPSGDVAGQIPALVRCLYQAAYEFSVRQNLTHWLGFTSPGLRRMLLSQSVQLDAIGKPLQFRGMRQAYLIHWRRSSDQLIPNRQAYVSARLHKASVA